VTDLQHSYWFVCHRIKIFFLIRAHVAFETGGLVSAGMSGVIIPVSIQNLPLTSVFIPDEVAYFGPKSLAGFGPKWVAYFTPK